MQPKPVKGFIHPVGPQSASKSKTSSPTSRYWHRVKDCFKGHGPDMFVGVINRPRSCPNRVKRDQWSGWDTVLDRQPSSSDCYRQRQRQQQHYPRHRNRCNEDDIRGHNMHIAKSDKRLESRFHNDRVYNFQTRRYEKFRGDELRDGGMWSDVRYCKDERHYDPLLIRDAWGRVFVLRKEGVAYSG